MKGIMSANDWINYTALFDLPLVIVFNGQNQDVMFKLFFSSLFPLFVKRRCGSVFYHGIIILCGRPCHLCGISCNDRHNSFVERFIEKNAMKVYLFQLYGSQNSYKMLLKI